MKRIKRPKRMEPEKGDIYTGFCKFSDTNEIMIYIGGPYYQDHAQIHLNKSQVKQLTKWLVRANSYLQQEPTK